MFVIILFALTFIYTNADAYVVPKPTIKVLEPSGFRVSIPDDEGIQLFAIHANINKPMDGLEGNFFSIFNRLCVNIFFIRDTDRTIPKKCPPDYIII